MAVNTQTIRIDLNPGRSIPVAYSHQGDTARSFVFEVYNNGEAFPLAGYTAKIAAMLPADNGYRVIAGDNMADGAISENTITATLPADFTAKPGRGVLTIVLTGSGATIRPINVDLRIQKSADAPETIAGASDFAPVLERYMAEDMQTYINAWLDAHPEAMQYYISGSKLVLDENGILSIQNDTDEIVEALDLDTLRSEVTDLKSDLFHLPENGQKGQALVSDGEGGVEWDTESVSVDEIAVTFRSGGISSSDGSEATATNRVRTGKISMTSFDYIEVDSGFKFSVAIYEEGVNSTYIGMWNGNGSAKSITWFTEKVESADIIALFPNAHVRIVGSKVDDSTISDTFNSVHLYKIQEITDSGIPDGVKSALLACFRNVAWINDQGEEFYQNLYDALYGQGGESVLPDAYQQVYYIKSNGNQYISLGVQAEVGIKITMKVKWSDTTTRQLHGGDSGMYFGVVNGKYQISQTGTTTTAITASTVSYDDVVYERASDSEVNYTINGVSGSVNQSVSAHPGIIGVFAMIDHLGYASYPCSCSLRNKVLVENGGRSFELYPCYRKSDGVIGLYDIIGNAFYTNAGSGVFEKGADI